MTIKIILALLHELVETIRKNYSIKNYTALKNNLKILRDDLDFNFENLYDDEKKDLEKIQYETLIHFDMYVEALEYSGIFDKNNNQYLRSNRNNYFNYFEELKAREEDI